MQSHHETIIIGGGLSGLSCATKLATAGSSFTLLEATDRVGGRVRTDNVDGFQLDHGFQVLLTAYPACRELLDYDALRLRPFEPGALIRQNGQFNVLGDPWRRPTQAIATALNPIGSLGDKLRIAKLRRASKLGRLEDVYQRPQQSTLERLREDGFTEKMIDQFFTPFLGGVYLDESLSSSSRMLEFVFRMFAAGDIAVPADGMAAIPRQLADGLPRGSLRLSNAVTGIEFQDGRYQVVRSDTSMLTADRVVIAVESNAAARLLGINATQTEWSGTTNLYYTADHSPNTQKLLMLRGDEKGPVQSAVVLSDIAPQYAPAGKSLVSISIDGKDFDPESGDLDAFEPRIRAQLADWFGPFTQQWELLRTYRVPFGLPRGEMDPVMKELHVPKLGDSDVPNNTLFICGDHMETPSIQGAMNSGIRVASQITAPT